MGLLKAIYLSELPLNFVAPSIEPVQSEKEKMQKLEDVLRKKSKELSTRTNSGKSSLGINYWCQNDFSGQLQNWKTSRYLLTN